MKRSIISLEVGKKGETFHVQGFVEFTSPAKHKIILKKLGTHEIHFEESRGTVKQNYKYITKIEPLVSGEKPIYMTGEWDLNILSRLDLNVSDFVDYAVKYNTEPDLGFGMSHYVSFIFKQ